MTYFKVFKFGGASVKSADAVINAAKILETESSQERIFIVVSAIGKTTNLLENITRNYFQGNEFNKELEQLKSNHFEIVQSLFPTQHSCFNKLHNLFAELEWQLEETQTVNFDFHYDQIVSFGEQFSTLIVSEFMIYKGLDLALLDSRDLIKTDDNYRDASILWNETIDSCNKVVKQYTQKYLLTQGFIGCTLENYSTTLGREGSDYTAAVIAYCVNAKSVTIWKDVDGVLNADPKIFKDSVLIKHLSFQDTIELSYYGATVIHPKTIKPLQNKNIPLFVRSFINLNSTGTKIDNDSITEHVPSTIIKNNQVLISIFPKDFSFIVEDNLSRIFGIFASQKVKINLMQNSAISFSVCIDYDENKLENLMNSLKEHYKVLFNQNIQLITIRYYNTETEAKVLNSKKVLLEQRSRHTLQVLTKDN